MSNEPLPGLPAPTVSFVSGEPTTDGSSVVLRIETDDGGTRDFALPIRDVDDFVGLLLELSAQASARWQAPQPNDSGIGGAAIPLRSLSVASSEKSDEILLVLETAATTLTFSLPMTELGRLGRTLMTLRASTEAFRA